MTGSLYSTNDIAYNNHIFMFFIFEGSAPFAEHSGMRDSDEDVGPKREFEWNAWQAIIVP